MLDNLEKIFAIVGVVATVIQSWVAIKSSRVNPPIVDLGDSQWRVLRALLNEENGRHLNIYISSESYQTAVKELLQEGFIRFEFNKYYLTVKGKKALKEHLKNFMASKLP